MIRLLENSGGLRRVMHTFRSHTATAADREKLGS
jgi:hypothetical protein